MEDRQSQNLGARRQAPLDLASAYIELSNLMLRSPEVVDFLYALSRVAAAISPGSHCTVLVHCEKQGSTFASNDDIARQMEPTTVLRGTGPCFEAMRAAQRVLAPEMSTETRWGDYSARALDHGINSMVALPLIADGRSVGAITMFATQAGAFTEPVVSRIQQFADQVATALTIVLREAGSTTMIAQLNQGVETRAMIDQAVGIIIGARKIGAREALEVLRQTSQNSNRRVSVIAAEIIQTTTGHAPDPPRPLAVRN